MSIQKIDTDSMSARIKTAAQQQKQAAEKKIKQSVASSVQALETSKAQANEAYDEQLKKTNIDEAKALDNQALYAEARGDRGGIGKAQYGSIQNTASTERASIAKQRRELENDTAVKIAELQQNGDIELAAQLAEIESDYSDKLNSLEKWATEKNISVEEFNEKLLQWQQEYQLDVMKMERDYDLQQQKIYSSAGQAMLKYGIYPTQEQLDAMGWTTPQYMAYMANYG